MRTWFLIEFTFAVVSFGLFGLHPTFDYCASTLQQLQYIRTNIEMSTKKTIILESTGANFNEWRKFVHDKLRKCGSVPKGIAAGKAHPGAPPYTD
jgi:hypothetical protein